jgi:hypothetical protein
MTKKGHEYINQYIKSLLMKDMYGLCHSETNYNTYNDSFKWNFWTILFSDMTTLPPSRQHFHRYDLVLVTI